MIIGHGVVPNSDLLSMQRNDTTYTIKLNNVLEEYVQQIGAFSTIAGTGFNVVSRVAKTKQKLLLILQCKLDFPVSSSSTASFIHSKGLCYQL